MPSKSALDYENRQALALVQASLGAISSNVVSISLRCAGDDIHLYYVLEHDSAADREDIDDVVFELSALQMNDTPPIHTHVSISSEPIPLASDIGRCVFLRKPA